MSTPSQPWLQQQVNGTFVGPVAARSDQPKPVVVPIDWNAFDVPRLWSMVRHEDDQIAWGQVKGFENLAQLLLAHHDSLRRLRDSLADGWSPETNPAAAKFFGFLDHLIWSMGQDAVAHGSTSRALNGILTTLKTAKEKIGSMKQDWDLVTTDWVPEWWDDAATELNQRARQVIADTDAAVADHRGQIQVASEYRYPAEFSDVVVPTDTRGGSSTATGTGERGRVSPPPPVPGYDPVIGRGPDLQGLPGVPQPVPALPGSPISVLPVPPGHSNAPNGGAYVLPGPGIGRGGWIYPMPTPPGQNRGVTPGHGVTGAGVRGGSSPAAGTAGMVPVAPLRGAGRGGRGRRAGSRDLIWEVAHGVPPVIGDIPHEVAEVKQRQKVAEDTFVDWFADLATPWDTDVKADIGRRSEPAA